MSSLSDEKIIDELKTWFANRLHVLKGDTISFFEDLLFMQKMRHAQNDPGHLSELIPLAERGDWASHRALMELFRRSLVHASELQDYAARHGNKRRKPGPKHDWSFDNCILSAVSWALRMKNGIRATRNPSRVITSQEFDDDEGTIQSACALVARALRRLGNELLERQPPELVALFGQLTRKDIKEFMLEEGTIQRRWEQRPWRCASAEKIQEYIKSPLPEDA